MPARPEPSRAYAAAALLLTVVVGLRAFSPWLGFYHDDWFFLERVDSAGGLWGAIKYFAIAGMWNRPVEIVQIPLTFWLAGLHLAVGQVLLGLLECAEAWLIFRLVERLTRSRGAALLCAALIALHPARFVVHVWLSISPLWFAHVFLLLSLLAHLDWIERGRPGRLAASQTLYLASVLCYESAAFLPLMLAGARLAAGRLSKERVLTEARLLAPYLATLAAALAWQRVVGPWLFAAANPKTLGLSPLHFVKAYLRGLECVTTRPFDGMRRSLPELINSWPAGLALAWAAATALLTWALAPSRERPEVPRVLLGAGLAVWLGAYLPFAVSGDYSPQFFGIMARTNGTGVLAGGLWIAALLLWGASRRRAPAAAALSVMIGGFLLTDWQFAREWAMSWSAQKGILARCAAKVSGVPGPAAVLLKGAPTAYRHAAVFDAFWDFDSALKLAAGRKDLKGNVVSPRLSFEEDKVVERSNGQSMWEHPYRNLYVYDAAKDELRRQEGPSASRPLAIDRPGTASSKGSSGSGAKSSR